MMINSQRYSYFHEITKLLKGMDLSMSEKAIAKAEKIVKSKTAAENMGVGVTLSLIDSEGYPTTSTLSISKADGIRQITFASTLDSNKAKRAKENSRASVCIFDDDYESGAYYNITLVGDIEVLNDIETKKETWYTGLEEHYPNGGVDDPNYCVLRFTTKRYSLWVDMGEDEATGSF
jgi:general stress protein 26